MAPNTIHPMVSLILIGSIFFMPIVAILGFLDILPVPTIVSWIALAIFVVNIIVYNTAFKKRVILKRKKVEEEFLSDKVLMKGVRIARFLLLHTL